MLLHGKAIDSLTEDDLLALIGTEEDKTIDFKGHGYRYTDPKDDRWKGELLTDVTSFANADGGWIVCGMAENEGTATELIGLSEINPDEERRRLEQCINTGIEPLIHGLRVRIIDLPSAEGRTIVFYIPRSLTAPHRVKATRKFHVRRSNWNDEMNMDEVRAAFNLSSSYVEQIRSFRSQRLQALANNNLEELPVLLTDGYRMVLHVVPLLFSEPSSQVDLSVFGSRTPPRWVHQTYFHYGRHNLEGFVRPNGNAPASTPLGGYIQVFRNGAIEAVETGSTHQQGDRPLIGLTSIENFALENLGTCLPIQQNLGITPPLVIMLSLVGVKEHVFINYIGARFNIDHPPVTIWRNIIVTPDVVVENYPDKNMTSALKPAFDMLWNAAGWPRSMSYDSDGNWTGPKPTR